MGVAWGLVEVLLGGLGRHLSRPRLGSERKASGEHPIDRLCLL